MWMLWKNSIFKSIFLTCTINTCISAIINLIYIVVNWNMYVYSQNLVLSNFTIFTRFLRICTVLDLCQNRGSILKCLFLPKFLGHVFWRVYGQMGNSGRVICFSSSWPEFFERTTTTVHSSTLSFEIYFIIL